MFKPIEQKSLNEYVYHQLREAILNGDIASGERIYEARIAQKFGISRAPIREALKSLESDGLVETVRRRGTYVKVLSEQDVQEVYSLRAALESLAFRIAAQKITPEKIEELEQIIHGMEKQAEVGNIEALSELDTQFHKTIICLTGHRRLLSAWMSNISQIKLLSRRVLATLYEDLSEIPTRHQVLLDALRSEPEEERVKKIEAHIASISERVINRSPITA